MPLTPEQKNVYLEQARAQDGMHTEPDEEFQNMDPNDPTIAQVLITGRRRVGQPLSTQGPTPISPITRKDAIAAINPTTNETKLFPTKDRSSLIRDISTLPLTTAKRSTQANEVGDNFEPNDQDTLRSPRPHKTIGYTRQSRLTPKRNK